MVARYVGPDAEGMRAAVDERLPRWIDWLGITAVAASVARLIAQHAAVFGTDVALSRDAVATLLFRSGWGKAWWVATLAAVTITWIAPRLRQRSGVAWVAAAAVTLLFVASQPWSGHPAAADVPWLATSIQLLHLIGAGGWLGSLALLTVVAIPAAKSLEVAESRSVDARIAGLVRAFSPTALAFAALLATTGTVTAWRHLGGLLPSRGVAQSGAPRPAAALKLGFLSIVLAAGVYNWRRVRPALGEPHATVRLRRSSLVELTAALLVVVVTAVLVASPMPGE
ncbi:MAG: CopD family protein [Gemmatimonadetes bacterium]|nr:CopD family protein [Gemmatimonadota bacterium]